MSGLIQEQQLGEQHYIALEAKGIRGGISPADGSLLLLQVLAFSRTHVIAKAVFPGSQ
jgi:hypothetical protein